MFMFLQSLYLIHSPTTPTKSKIARATVLEKLRISQVAEDKKHFIDLKAHYSNHLSPSSA